MACPNGYIEVNGECLYAFGNDSGVAPDGTPLPPKGGGFWDWMKQNLPDILIGVGTVWESSQKNNQPSNPNPTPPAPPQAASKMPVWVWVLLGLAGLAVLVLLLRKR